MLLRYLFPHARQQARARLLALRHETLPHYRQRAQSRIYQFIVKRQLNHKRRKEAGNSILGHLRRKRVYELSRPKDAGLIKSLTMSQQIETRDFGGGIGDYISSHERGSRRKKLAGFLKTANDLRQSYQQSYGLGGQNDGEADGSSVPGAFPDLAIVRNGDEEMVLFPSYARRHHARRNRQLHPPGADQDIRSSQTSGDSEYWKKQWAKYEEDNSIVDVDVRGWIYAPHRGPMTRKNKILMGLARHLSGIPAPSGDSVSRAASPPATHHDKVEIRNEQHDKELVEREAKNIMRKGDAEADIARRGGYSEHPSRYADVPSLDSSPRQSRTPSPRNGNIERRLPHRLSNLSLHDKQHDAPGPGPLPKRASWNQPSEMNPAELAVANANLMARLKPFLTTPLVSTPLTVFFYNDETSKSRTITTDDSGYFNLRAALDFVPTNVRVLASDKLSALEPVHVIEPTGISMISDIDDTIKHSAIGGGAKEIFRNTFIRDLDDLTIEGVKEWYTKMDDLGVRFHYVSNSPWQLYPVLVSFFAEASLPRGSFHLKQYSGMLQGIFEPVAERKKGTLERIMRDFPNRRFILVGDSGEADLELYTDLVQSNTKQILGVFIRDVTTTKPHGFFDSSMGKAGNSSGSKSPLRGRQGNNSLSPKQSANLEQSPILPPRQQTRSTNTLRTNSKDSALDMVGFNEEPKARIQRSMTDSSMPAANEQVSAATKSLPPSRPSKPPSLRSQTGDCQPQHQPQKVPSSSNTIPRKPPPPPPKPRNYLNTQDGTQPIEPSPLSQTQNVSPPRTRSSSLEHHSYRSSVRNKVTSVYNTLPSWYSTPQQPPPDQSATSEPRATPPELPSRPRLPTSSPSADNPRSGPPPIPPRRPLYSYPAAAAQYASKSFSSSGRSGSGSGSTDNAADDEEAGTMNSVNKKEDLWNRRLARAKEIFNDKGVMLRVWRVGEDVMDDAVGLVERAVRERE